MSRRERHRRRQRHRGSPVKRALLLTAVLGTVGIALGVLGVVGWVVAVADSAPNINDLKPRDPGQLTQVFASDGSALGYIPSPILRTFVPDSQIPQVLRNATIAIEDRRFYKHGGVDYQGILRAGIQDVLGGGKNIQGGSTLTMQLVRNIYLSTQQASSRSIKRKIIEAKLAEELEKKHTKAWILTQYLNDVDYGTLGGQTAIGVGAASQLFFNESVSQLDLAQAALLAGLPQAPSQYNPFQAKDLARARRHDVLVAMVKSRYITQGQANAANGSPLQLHANTVFVQHREPYVFDYVKQELSAKLCPQTPANCSVVETGGLKVYTTIDLKKQQEARQAIANNEGQPGDPAAGLVTVDPATGHILAMATSSQYGRQSGQTSFDYATQSHRQTGSAFKVFVLMTLIHDFQGDPNQTFYNSHLLSPGWLPGYPTYSVHTSELSYAGNISLTDATIRSDNTVFAQLDADVGPDKVRSTAYAMGITSHLDAIPAEGIGGLRIGVSPLEMADAYATLANGGWHIPPTAITKVVFPDGSVKNLGDPRRKQVFTDGEAYAAIQVLKGVITSGTGTAAQYGCPAAGKTGTTSNYTDAWFVGFTPKLATSVWVGYPNSTISMTDVNGLGPGFGGTLAAPIWHDYMTQASGGYCGDFTPPNNPFQGTAFTGQYAVTGKASANNTTGASTTGTTTTSTSTTSTNPYNNPTLYQHQPQPPSTGGGGVAPPTHQPPGFGNGHLPGGGGGGGKTH
jgi:penicillin-binding protein 1A